MQKIVSYALASAVGCVLVWAASVGDLSAAATRAKPEEVGLSSERLRRVSEFAGRHIAAGHFPGVVTLVARYGRIAHFEPHGLADLNANRPMRTDTVFRIASMTKPIVGAAILMVAEEGKVGFNDRVSKFIPELKQLTVAVAEDRAVASEGRRFRTASADREITIRDLLTHTSGLVSGPISSGEAAKIAVKEGETLADYVPRLALVPLEFQPGTRWA